MRTRGLIRDERGAAVAEFAMVAGLLTAVALSVMQLALGLHVRTVMQDAAAEGARFGALAGADAAAGVGRTEQLIAAVLDAELVESVTAAPIAVGGYPAIEITVRGTLPLLGLLGPTALEVRGSAAVETLD